MTFRKRDDDGQPTLVSLYPEGVDNPIPGLFGGQPGGGARGRIVSPDGTVIHDCGTGALVEIRTTGEIVEFVLAGGAGYGNPAERDTAAISRDIALGYVTPAHAARHYRVEDEKPAPADHDRVGA